MAGTVEDEAALRAEIARFPHWYHRIELAPGVVTPGVHDSARALALLDELGLPQDARGRRVLDVGCRDGFFAFELERRGAEVVALDYAAAGFTGFPIAARLLGSRVPYVLANVYDLDPETHGTFDLVLFLGVLYHLRNPLLALDRVRAVTRSGGDVFIETQIADARLHDLEAPLWQFLPGGSLNADPTNVWLPNFTGLVRAVEDCQIAVLLGRPLGERAAIHGRAFYDKDLDYYRALDSSRDLYGRGRGGRRAG